MAIAVMAIVCLALLAVGQSSNEEPSVVIERSISTGHALPGSTFRVTLMLRAREDLNGVGIRETLPYGWTVHPLETAGAAFKRPENEWVFSEAIDKGSTLHITYDVTVPAADRLYADTLPECFDFRGRFQATVPQIEIPIGGDGAVEISTALPIPTAVAHLIPASEDEPDRIDLRLTRTLNEKQLNRAIEWWATNAAVPWTEGQIIDLPMLEKLSALYETCTNADDLLPQSLDPELVASRTIETFLPCDSVLLPEGCLDPGLSARQFQVNVEITGSYDAYGIGLVEWFPETWRVTPVEHPGFAYRPSHTEWFFPGRLPVGESLRVTYLVEVVASTTSALETSGSCCGTDASFTGAVSSGLECSESPIIGESRAYVWDCLPVLVAISRWDVEEDRLDARLSDLITFPQVQRAMQFWLTNMPVPHTCGYTVGYHMLKRIIAHWRSGTPITQPLPDDAPQPCDPGDPACGLPDCPAGSLCYLAELQDPEDFVGVPEPPRISIDINGPTELTCAVTQATLAAVVEGGTTPYRIEWHDGRGNLIAESVELIVDRPGIYTAVAISVGGCRVGKQILITQDIEAPRIAIDGNEPLTCSQSQVELTASILGGRAPFAVSWRNEHGASVGSGPSLTVDHPGEYTVTVVGANGCSDTATVEVTESREAPAVDAGPDQLITCLRSVVSLEGSATGGVPPYIYSWLDPNGVEIATVPMVDVEAPGTYTLTVTGQNGCAQSCTTTVSLDTEPPLLSLSVDGPITCANSSVVLAAGVSGGRAPYAVAWMNSAGTILGESTTLRVTEPGTYTVVAQGANGCVARGTIDVVTDRTPPQVEARVDGTLTCASPTVTLRVLIEGGTAPFEVSWTNASGVCIGRAETAAVELPGTYEVTVTGANGCAASDMVTVTQDISAPTVSASVDGVLTCATTTVAVTSAVDGGRAPYQIAWTDASDVCIGRTETVTVSEPGTYTVTATGANGCTASDTVTVAENVAAPAVTASADGTLTCAVTEVALHATIAGGSGPFEIAWTDALGACIGRTETVNVSEPGTYTITATGQNGCAASDTVTVAEDIAPPVVNATANGTITCANPMVCLSVEISSESEPYTIEWVNGSGAVLASTRNVMVEEAGTYTVTVVGQNGCSITDTVVVSEDIAPPVVNACVSGVITCATPQVMLSAEISGGTEPYAIEWLDELSSVLATTPTILVVQTGTYTVSVVGANGCVATDTVDVEGDLAPPRVEVTSSGDLTCTSPEATLTATIEGGRPPYEIAWIDASGTWIGKEDTVVIDAAGEYTVAVTGANGCTGRASVTVAEDFRVPALVVTVDGTLTCATPMVHVDVEITGGAEPFSIVWADDEGRTVATTRSLTVDEPGTYNVTVTGANGCTASGAVAVPADYLAPVVQAFTSNVLTCAHPETVLSAVIDAGRPPYEIVWLDASGAWLGTDETVIVDASGEYTVTVTGANGCTTRTSVTVQKDARVPTISASADGVLSCAISNVSAHVEIAGGAEPYVIVWTDDDGNGLATSHDLTVDQAGTYNVLVTGANGCSATASVTVVGDYEAPSVEASASGVLTCATSEVTLTAEISGGRAPFTCVWTDCCGTQIGTGREVVVDVPGLYIVTVTGQNGCADSATVDVMEDLAAPSIIATVDGELSCAVDRVTLTAEASGGRTPYTILWTDDDGNALATTPDMTVDQAGTYNVIVAGQNGCSATASVEVVGDYEAPSVEASASGVLTCASSEVTLTAEISGGRAPFTCVWTDCCGTQIGTGREVVVDAPGPYIVTVTGQNGCADSAIVDVTEDLAAPNITATVDGEITCAVDRVTLSAEVSGGRAPYTVSWIDPTGSVIATCLEIEVGKAGTYTVTATGENGCAASTSITVHENVDPPVLDLGPTRSITCAEPEVILSVLVSGGVAPFSYRWTDSLGNLLGLTRELLVALPGTYRVAVTGANACSAIGSIRVEDGTNAPVVDLGPDCDIDCAVGLELVPTCTGGVEPFTYAWYNECDVVISTAPTLTIAEAGVYMLIVRSANGCIASDSITVYEATP